MDKFERLQVKMEAWANRHIWHMSDDENVKDLLRQFSGSNPSRDAEYRQYILALFFG
jgi:hypothetical protein